MVSITENMIDVSSLKRVDREFVVPDKIHLVIERPKKEDWEELKNWHDRVVKKTPYRIIINVTGLSREERLEIASRFSNYRFEMVLIEKSKKGEFGEVIGSWNGRKVNPLWRAREPIEKEEYIMTAIITGEMLMVAACWPDGYRLLRLRITDDGTVQIRDIEPKRDEHWNMIRAAAMKILDPNKRYTLEPRLF